MLYTNYYICDKCKIPVHVDETHTDRECRKAAIDRYISRRVKIQTLKWTSLFGALIIFIGMFYYINIQGKINLTLTEMNTVLLKNQMASDMAVIGMSQAVDLISKGGKK